MSDWRLTPQNSALVVIDVQEKLMNVMPRRSELVGAIQKLIGAARVLKLPTLVTAQYIKGLGPVCAEIVEATPGISPLEKMAFSCCGSEEFLRAVKDLRRQRIILCGIEAHVCVSQTCLDLLDEGFRVFVVADAVSSRTPENYRFGLDRMSAAGAVIVSTEMALFELLEQAGTAEFKQILNLVK